MTVMFHGSVWSGLRRADLGGDHAAGDIGLRWRPWPRGGRCIIRRDRVDVGPRVGLRRMLRRRGFAAAAAENAAEIDVGQFPDLADRGRHWPGRKDLAELGAGRIDVWIACVSDWADDAPGDALVGAEVARAAAFVREADRVRFTTARVLLRRLLAGYLGAAPEDLTIESGRFGKPALVGRWASSRLAFNVSKSGDHLAFGFAVGREIGLDVESLEPPRLQAGEPEALAGFFTATEAALVRSRSAADARATFYRLWVCKEACLKCRGTGLSMPLDEIAIEFTGEGMASGRCRGDDYAIRSFADRGDVVSAVAIEGSTMPEARVVRLAVE